MERKKIIFRNFLILYSLITRVALTKLTPSRLIKSFYKFQWQLSMIKKIMTFKPKFPWKKKTNWIEITKLQLKIKSNQAKILLRYRATSFRFQELLTANDNFPNELQWRFPAPLFPFIFHKAITSRNNLQLSCL